MLICHYTVSIKTDTAICPYDVNRITRSIKKTLGRIPNNITISSDEDAELKYTAAYDHARHNESRIIRSGLRRMTDKLDRNIDNIIYGEVELGCVGNKTHKLKFNALTNRWICDS